jgi:YHS domain-containing protein
MKKIIVLVVFVFLSSMIMSAAIARQTADEKVVCPVSGETMLKSQAVASYEFEGKTYYFCGEDCKAKFVKDPAKYIGKTAEMKDVYTCPMHPEVQSDKPGKCPKCGMNLEKKAMPMAHGHAGMEALPGKVCPVMGVMGMMSFKDTTVVTENIKDGVVIKITTKDPEMVKKIQEMGAKFKAMHENK